MDGIGWLGRRLADSSPVTASAAATSAPANPGKDRLQIAASRRPWL